jgi:hypothetical protein
MTKHQRRCDRTAGAAKPGYSAEGKSSLLYRMEERIEKKRKYAKSDNRKYDDEQKAVIGNAVFAKESSKAYKEKRNKGGKTKYKHQKIAWDTKSQKFY